MTTDTRGAVWSRSGVIIFGVRGCARRAHRPEGAQISPVCLRRRRLIVDDSREASPRILGAALVDQNVPEMAQHLDPRAAKAVDEPVGGGAVTLAHQLDEQVALGLALERLGIQRARLFAQERLRNAAEVTVLARIQQEVEILARRDEAFVESAA